MSQLKNGPATNIQYMDAFSCSNNWASIIEEDFTETYGVPYSAGVHGWNIHYKATFSGTPQFNVTVTTPWGSVTPTIAPGLVTNAYVRAVWYTQLTVNSSCDWTVTGGSLVFYMSINGGPETTILTISSSNDSGTGYNEILNVTTMQLSPPVSGCLGASLPSCPGSLPTAYSNTYTLTQSGGYEPEVGGVYTPDLILLDTTSVSGACSPCAIGLPNISGTNSYNVSISATFTQSLTLGAVDTISCPNCIPSSVPFQSIIYTDIFYQTSVAIQSKYAFDGQQTITTDWNCYLDPGGNTSGGSTNTTNPGITTCGSTRYASQSIGTVWCYFGHLICSGGGTCIGPSASACCYNAESQLTHPTAPPCTSSTPICAFTRPGDWGYVVYTDGTDMYVRRYVLSFDAQFIAEVLNISAVSGCWVEGAFQGAYIFYVKNGDTNVYWTQSIGLEDTWFGDTVIAPGTQVASTYAEPLDMTMSVIFDSGTWTAYTSVGGSPTWVTGGTVVTGAIETQGSLCYEDGSIRQWRFSYPSSGSIISYVSQDGGNTWTLS